MTSVGKELNIDLQISIVATCLFFIWILIYYHTVCESAVGAPNETTFVYAQLSLYCLQDFS